MDRRFVLAIVLMMAVLLVPSLFIKRPPPKSAAAADSVEAAPVAPQAPATITRGPEETPPAAPPAAAPANAEAPAGEPAPEDTVTVTSPLYSYRFSTRGGRLVEASILSYKSMRPGEPDRPAQILLPNGDFLALALLTGGDTIPIRRWSLTPSTRSLDVSEPAGLVFTGGDERASVTIEYRFRPDAYRFDVTGSITGVGPNGGTLLIGMGPGLRNTEADSVEHAREVGIVTRNTRSDLTHFSQLDVGEPRTLTGPFEWVAVKSKYFAFAVLAIDTTRAGHGGIGGAQLLTRDQQHKTPQQAAVWASMAVPAGGDFGYSLYVGPMEYPRLKAIGAGFDDINPYGWSWLRPIIRPVAVAARWLLVWFHEQLGIAYGLALMLFGVLIRVVLWPLNQKAMRAGMEMQAIQPLLKQLQEKYKDEPQKLQQEMFKVYKEHKVNPFSGCWPLLLPWPVLIALFFVFQNSIELRGAAFLWLPDLARPDPIFIIPVLMGVSMYAVTRVGQIGLPANPQMKIMLYVMPVMMVVFFFNLASGLNLYYATINLASIPQQWMIAQERLKRAPATAAPAPAKGKKK